MSENFFYCIIIWAHWLPPTSLHDSGLICAAIQLKENIFSAIIVIWSSKNSQICKRPNQKAERWNTVYQHKFD